MNTAVDMASTIIPKSNQTNFDDLLAGPRTITITAVKASGAPDQPIAVHYEGDNGKPFMPCKSMRRVMVAAWGPDAAQYVGRSMTLYGDPKVAFGGMQVGGIRISHMSHIERDLTLALTVTKAKRSPFQVRKLEAPAQTAPADRASGWAAEYIAAVNAAETPAALAAFVESKAKKLEELREKRPELHLRCDAAVRGRVAALTPGAEPPATTTNPDDF
jgi:hypothetical protein